MTWRVQRQLTSQPAIRATLDEFVAVNLSVAATAGALSPHPCSLRCRLARITELTGRDPRKLTDLLELIAASHVLTRQAGPDA